MLLAGVTLSSYGQFLDKVTARWNAVRFAKSPGLFSTNSLRYDGKVSFLNGFDFGYPVTDKLNAFIGVREAFFKVDYHTGFSSEMTKSKGNEFTAGLTWSPGREKKLFLSYSLSFFGEFTKLEGTHANDYPPQYEINHRKSYMGIAPIVQLNFRLDERFSLFASTRYRLGVVTLNGIESSQPDLTLFPYFRYNMALFEPLSGFGLQIGL